MKQVIYHLLYSILILNNRVIVCQVTNQTCRGIETLYQYMKNTADFNNLMSQDYYKEQGLAFIVL